MFFSTILFFCEDDSMILDIAYYTHNKYQEIRSIERHEIKFHELTFLFDGEMTYYINDEMYHMVSGDIIYIPAGSMRQRITSGNSNDYISINFHSLDKMPLKYLSKNSINAEIKLLLSYFDSIFQVSYLSDINQNKMIYALEALVCQISDNMNKNHASSLANNIANFLSNHYREKITLDIVSREMFFSAVYCESEFRKYMGKSIINYLIDIRVGEAKKLLKDTSMSCANIASVVGFDDANYFSRVFKKRTGYSPLQYRSQNI